MWVDIVPAKYTNTYYLEHKNQIAEWNKKWQIKNVDKVREIKRRWKRRNQEFIKHDGKRRLFFKGKTLWLKQHKLGICKICRRTIESGIIKRTNMHHILYDSNDPLKHTIEVCIRDHVKIHDGFE
jgi:hypothetical protein